MIIIIAITEYKGVQTMRTIRTTTGPVLNTTVHGPGTTTAGPMRTTGVRVLHIHLLAAAVHPQPGHTQVQEAVEVEAGINR